MKHRIVYDVEVPDEVGEAHVAKIAADTASNLRWGLVHDLDVYPQNLARPVITFYGVRRLDPPAAPAQHVLTELGPGPGRDR